MNSLRKTFLALSLIAVFPATVQAVPSWSDCKNTISEWFTAAKDAVVARTPSKDEVSQFASRAKQYAQANPRKTAAATLATVGGLAAAGFFAKKYKVGQKVANVAGMPKRALKAGYAKFAGLPKTRKAGVVLGGAVAVVGAAYLAKTLWAKYHANNSGN